MCLPTLLQETPQEIRCLLLFITVGPTIRPVWVHLQMVLSLTTWWSHWLQEFCIPAYRHHRRDAIHCYSSLLAQRFGESASAAMLSFVDFYGPKYFLLENMAGFLDFRVTQELQPRGNMIDGTIQMCCLKFVTPANGLSLTAWQSHRLPRFCIPAYSTTRNTAGDKVSHVIRHCWSNNSSMLAQQFVTVGPTIQ